MTWEETETRRLYLQLLRGAVYPGLPTLRWAADEIERLQRELDEARAMLDDERDSE